MLRLLSDGGVAMLTRRMGLVQLWHLAVDCCGNAPQALCALQIPYFASSFRFVELRGNLTARERGSSHLKSQLSAGVQ